MLKLQKKPKASRAARCPPSAKSRKVGRKLIAKPVLDAVVVDTQGREVLESLVSGHRCKFDWYDEGEYFLNSEEALELLRLSAPIHYSGRFGEVVLDYSQGAGWRLYPAL